MRANEDRQPTKLYYRVRTGATALYTIHAAILSYCATWRVKGQLYIYRHRIKFLTKIRMRDTVIKLLWWRVVGKMYRASLRLVTVQVTWIARAYATGTKVIGGNESITHAGAVSCPSQLVAQQLQPLLDFGVSLSTDWEVRIFSFRIFQSNYGRTNVRDYLILCFYCMRAWA